MKPGKPDHCGGRILEGKKVDPLNTTQLQAAAITKAASKQTYYTIRLLVDRELVNDAYRAYGYFRWVDDVLDAQTGGRTEKLAFVNRQRELLEACYRGDAPGDLCLEEQMLADLVHHDTGKNPGLRAYLHNMMAVMEFDAERRGRLISQAELSEYTRALATAVTEAMFYFIGHDDPAPDHAARYLSVTAAHITHMLRDACEDAEVGYLNIPVEYLQAHRMRPQDVGSSGCQEWVCQRVQLARLYFKLGSNYLSQVKNLRCRLAGYAYTARFVWMLRAIERDNYCLRSEYPERKSLSAGLWMSWTALASLFTSLFVRARPNRLAAQSMQIEES